MLNFNRKQFVNPEISKYIKEQTNKWIQKHSNNSVSTLHGSTIGLSISDLVKQKHEDIKLPKCYLIIPFVSLLSFLAGYNLSNIIKRE